jgi:DNA polymerase-3 subunit delta
MAAPGIEIKPIYVLHGTDAFLREAYRHEVVSLAIGGGEAQTCVSTFDSDVDLATVLDELRTLPFLAPRRVVVIHDADEWVSRYREIHVQGAKAKPEVRRPLEDYLDAPSKNSSLVLIVNSWPPTRLSKLVAKVGQTYDCSAPGAGSLSSFIRQGVAKRHKKIVPQAAELLAAWVGADLGALDGELEKLSLYVGQRDTITPQDVSTLVTATAGPGLFDLTNAIIAQDAPAALRALEGMLSRRGEEFRVLGIIGSHLRRSAGAQQLAMSGKRADAALAPNMPPHAKAAFMEMLRKRPMHKLQGDFRKLIAADLGMKSGLEPHAAMQELVVGLCT